MLSVVRTVNSQMVIAYWLIGREIVEEQQKGKQRAGYGKNIIDELSGCLTDKYGRGFSSTNLRYFRTFYQEYADRLPEIRHMACGESDASENRHMVSGVFESLVVATEKPTPLCGI